MPKKTSKYVLTFVIFVEIISWTYKTS